MTVGNIGNLTIYTVLACDDVRKEISNKDILIGVYTSSINSPIKAVNALSIWFEMSSTKVGNFDVDIKIKPPGELPPLQMSLNLDVTKAIEHFSSFTPQITYPLIENGFFEVSLRLRGEKKWLPALKLPVVIGGSGGTFQQS